MQIVWDLLGRTEVQTAVVALIALAFGVVKKFGAVKRWKLTRVVECLEAGVRVTYEEYVRAMKDASVDGKLTDGERREAMARAIERAKEYAANDGIDLAKTYAKEFLPVLVERIVCRNKTVANVPFVFAPGPELP